MTIRRPVCFVLGAGASMPYGFPSGQELTALAKVDTGPLRESLIPNGVPEAVATATRLKEFQGALALSGQRSVDAFLEHRPEFVEIGKAVIAFHLIRREQMASLFRDNNPADWYQYLFGLMQGGALEEFAENNISFVTYNYDRSLQQYFYTALRNSYGQDPANVMRQIPIVHLHGCLADIPEQNSDRSRAYDSDVSSHLVRLAAQNIKILHEDTEDSDEYQQARHLLMEAEVILFLGFGFHPTNVRRLLKDTELAERRKLATRVNVTNAEWDFGAHRLCREFDINAPDGLDYDCLQFLRNILSHLVG